MLAPQLGQRVAPAGMLAPQFLQFVPIDPMGAEPIGIDELIIGGGIAPGAIVGLKVNAIIPPIRAKTKAAVVLSPISDQSQRGSDSIYNVFRSRRISAILAKFGDFFRF